MTGDDFEFSAEGRSAGANILEAAKSQIAEMAEGYTYPVKDPISNLIYELEEAQASFG